MIWRDYDGAEGGGCEGIMTGKREGVWSGHTLRCLLLLIILSITFSNLRIPFCTTLRIWKKAYFQNIIAKSIKNNCVHQLNYIILTSKLLNIKIFETKKFQKIVWPKLWVMWTTITQVWVWYLGTLPPTPIH